jgi:transposase
MPNRRPPYPAEFRQQMVALVRAGQAPAALAARFACSARTIRGWVAREGAHAPPPAPGGPGLAPDEREELLQLRRRVRQLEGERAILAQAMTWFAARSCGPAAPPAPAPPARAASGAACEGAVVHVLHPGRHPSGGPGRR